MKVSTVCAIVFAPAVLLTACGGGSGTSPAPAPLPTATSIPTPTSSPGTLRATGKLVDHETGIPLAGIHVGLAPWIAGATPVPQPTTDASGNIAITAAAAGKYLLVIGSDSPSDPNNRPTIHDAITLNAGASPQTLVAPTMPPVPSTTPNPIEQSGNFRLTTLTSNEQLCFALENSKRTSLSYAPVVSDEWLVENNRMGLQEEINGGGVGGGGMLSNYNGQAGLGCQSLIDNDYLASANMGNPELIWYAGSEVDSENGAVDEGMLDPRGPMPDPTPPSPWP